MTIPPALLERLAETRAPLARALEPESAAAACFHFDEIAGGARGEADFRIAMNADVAATTKMAEGINAFVAETEKLKAAITAKLEATVAA